MTTDAPTWTNAPLPVVEPESLAPLLLATSDLAFVVSPDGTIISVLTAERSVDDARFSSWIDRQMRHLLTIESIPKFERALKAIVESGTLDKLVELNHSDGEDWQYAVRYSFHRVGPKDLILMVGKDLRRVAEVQEQLVQAQMTLEREYEERREHDARYRVLMAITREAFLFVSSDGRIRDLNSLAASLLDGDVEQLIGAPIAKEFRHRRRGEFMDTLLSTAASDSDNELIVQSARTHRELFLTPTVSRAAGERLIICRLTTVEAAQPVDDQLRQDLGALFQKSTDAMVFCNNKGIITEANEAFLELADIPNLSDVKSRSLADFLLRGQVDLHVLIENTGRAGYMRMYSTHMTNDLGTQASVEISAVSLSDLKRSAFGFVIRDADRAMVVRKATHPVNQTEAPNHNVADLVGSASLKEIVAETSDVIEKMCIKTAVALTGNNRAAAAEMLGVSRQSLYVKLRKYDLLERTDH